MMLFRPAAATQSSCGYQLLSLHPPLQRHNHISGWKRPFSSLGSAPPGTPSMMKSTTRTTFFCRFRQAAKLFSSTTAVLENNHTSTELKAPPRDSTISVALIGPPNAGKSTLFNRFLCKTLNKTYRLNSNNSSKKKKRKGSGRIQSQSIATGGAIVSPIAGTTRDARTGWGRIGGTIFWLVDTAGVNGDRIDAYHEQDSATQKDDDYDLRQLEQQMMQQTIQTIQNVDLILLLLDARVGVTTEVQEIARLLRKKTLKHTKVVVVANKCEGTDWLYDNNNTNTTTNNIAEHLQEVARVGLGDAIPISAEHGDGMADLAVVIEETIQQVVPPEKRMASSQYYDEDDPDRPLQLAIVGRPNVGKSTLVNALLQQDRVLTGPVPGVTRDAIQIQFEDWQGRPIQLVDTAGIRKLTQRLSSQQNQEEHYNPDFNLEDLSVADALRAMKLADVAVLVLDAEAQYLSRQELAIANAVIEEGRSLVIAANKMDLLELDGVEYTPRDFAAAVHEQLQIRIPMLRNTPIVPMSSLTGECVQDLLPVVFEARDRWEQTIPTATLNGFLQEVVQGAPLPVVGGIQAKLKYLIQTKGRPPTFLLFANVPTLPEFYLRYLQKQFQDAFYMYGMPIRIRIQKQASPYGNSKNNKNRRGGSGVGGQAKRLERKYQQIRKHGAPLKRRKKKRRS